MTTASLLRQAQTHHQAGRLAEAQSLYRQILAAEPENATALHLLGLLAHQNGHHAGAEPLMARAASLAPRNAAFHAGHGHVLRALRRPAEAETAYRKALRLNPGAPESHHHLALALAEQQRPAEADRAFKEALRQRGAPVSPGLRLDYANFLLTQSRPLEAETVLRPALRALPNQPQILNQLGLASAAAGKPAEALALFDQALTVAPAYLAAAINRAQALTALGRAEEAAAAYATLAPRAPEDVELARAQAQILLGLGRGAEAEAPLTRLLAHNPADTQALHDLARAMAMQDRPEAALPLLEKLVTLAPENAAAWLDLGMAQRDLANWPAALAPHAEAARLDPENPIARACYAYALLANGDFARGWPEFAWRTRQPGNVKLAEPEWDGAPTGKTIIVHAEQGAGDTIQFARFLPLAALRARIVVAGPPALTNLLAQLPGIAELADGPPVPRYDQHCPLMSLPAKLGITPDHFADGVPYFTAPAAARAAWRQRLAPLPAPRVGLVWAGNPKYPADRKRSMPAQALAPILAVPGIAFVSLQIGAGPDLPEALYDASPFLTDFADTAGLIAELDLLISVDTAAAHLAGALAAPVWLLNRADTDWRWLLDRDDTPWYPSMRIFRQTARGDWLGVTSRVAAALCGWKIASGGQGLCPCTPLRP